VWLYLLVVLIFTAGMVGSSLKRRAVGGRGIRKSVVDAGGQL
jgi:hypothetical protein